MSGHSKWATIKRKKALIDSKRSAAFAKYIKAIEVSARNGGADPAGNPTLYDAIQKAKKNSVPSDNIERALKRASGHDESSSNWETIMYEGYGPGGVAILIERRYIAFLIGGGKSEQLSLELELTRDGEVVRRATPRVPPQRQAAKCLVSHLPTEAS